MSPLREVMRHVPTSVAVVTALHGGSPVGLTVGSFTSASLDPPLVSFFVGKTSVTWPRIHDTGRFCLNVLSAQQPQIATSFAARGNDRFRGLDWAPTPLGSPLLDGVLAWMDCSLYTVHEVGDHVAVAGLVQHACAVHDARPLVFFRGELAGLTC